MNSEYIEHFNLQLSEIDMISSMYPKEGELRLTDPAILSKISAFIEGKTEYLPPQIDFTLNLAFPEMNEKLELNVTLPHEYPYAAPTVFIRFPSLAKEELHCLNNAVSEFLSEQCKGDLVICSLLTWLSCNALKYKTVLMKEEVATTSKSKENVCFSRFWIYSHHIYSKNKRCAILQKASNFNFTGFCLPGKPGIICIEGSSRDCCEFFQVIKKMNWKKLTLIKEELFSLDSFKIDNLKHFHSFQEISFGVNHGQSREYHMDMGEFFKYLENHNCAYIFQEIFGFEGKSLNT